MVLDLPQPKAYLFAWLPVWLGNDYRWLEFIELRYSVMMGLPMIIMGVVN